MPTQWAGSTRRKRLPPDWHTHIRPYVLARDGFACQLRYDCCTSTATDVDHISRGDDHRPGNLQAACGPCHMRKTGAEGAAAKPRLNRPTETHPGLL